jgi:carnitine 3-dehydrogenase
MSDRVAPDRVRTVACVGAGVIGGGWVAYFLARGFAVRAWDPAPYAEGRLRTIVATAWPALSELGLAPGASVDNLTVAPTVADAVADADFVQESAPEQLDVKRALLAEIDAAARQHVVIASSTSGFGMTDMAADARSPHRLVVGHPFNPPYLIPLVEVVGGERTSAEVVAWTAAFFRHIGKSVITLDREVPGFVANRLQEALWREALHMVANGEATVEQIDASITDGPGLRWAFHGPMLTFHLAGGPGGMAHMLDHFGPSLLSPWTRLAAPDLTSDLRDRVIRGCAEEAGARTFADLVRERDRALVDLLRVLGKAPDG